MHQRVCELVVGHARAVRGAAALDGDEEDAPVRELTDGAPRAARVEHGVVEQLVRAEDRLAPGDEQGSAPEGPEGGE